MSTQTPLRLLASSGIGSVQATTHGPFGSLLAWMCGVRDGRAPIEFTVRPGATERWIRRSGRRRRTSRARTDDNGDLVERVGVVALVFDLAAHGDDPGRSGRSLTVDRGVVGASAHLRAVRIGCLTVAGGPATQHHGPVASAPGRRPAPAADERPPPVAVSCVTRRDPGTPGRWCTTVDAAVGRGRFRSGLAYTATLGANAGVTRRRR